MKRSLSELAQVQVSKVGRFYLGTMKLLLTFLLFVCSFGLSQSLEIVFTQEDQSTLEQLITLAQTNDLGVLEAQQAFDTGKYADSTGGRVSEALSVNAGTGLSGDMYGQVAPSYSLSVSLDVMDLFRAQDTSTLEHEVRDAKETARLKTVEAFVGWKVATQSATAASRALEAAEASLEVTDVRVEAGADVAASQLAAQSQVADAAIDLLTANGAVIVAVEKLASVVGTPTQETVALLEGATATASR